MRLANYGAIFTELKAMEHWYETEEELASMAGTSVMDYKKFVEDGLTRIATRQGVGIEEVRRIYNLTRKED